MAQLQGRAKPVIEVTLLSITPGSAGTRGAIKDDRDAIVVAPWRREETPRILARPFPSGWDREAEVVGAVVAVKPVPICPRNLVGRGQKLSHYRGQIEPASSLPRGATEGCFGEVMAEEC
jgi:hypothetical protein